MKLFIKAVSVVMVSLMLLFTGINSFADNSNSTVYIKTANDLDAIRNNLKGSYTLEADIDLSEIDNWVPIGTKEAPFTGNFNGGNHRITNMKIADVNKNEYFGLFGYIRYASISAFSISGTINNTVNDAFIAGVCAFADESIICGCIANVCINVEPFASESVICAGGIVGNLSKGCLSECSNTGCITIENHFNIQNAYSEILIGGIAGKAEGKISNCRNEGLIKTSEKAYLTAVGGIIGLFQGNINMGNPGVIGKEVVGYLYMHNICNIGEVIAIDSSRTSPIIGKENVVSWNTFDSNEPALYEGCYYLDSTGENNSTNEFKTFSKELGAKKETFEEFDFKSIWTIPISCETPILQIEDTSETRSIVVKTGYKAKIDLSGLTIKKSFSDNEEIALIEGEEIIGKHSGEAEIRVLLSNNKEIKYIVKVKFSFLGLMKALFETFFSYFVDKYGG